MFLLTKTHVPAVM